MLWALVISAAVALVVTAAMILGAVRPAPPRTSSRADLEAARRMRVNIGRILKRQL